MELVIEDVIQVGFRETREGQRAGSRWGRQ